MGAHLYEVECWRERWFYKVGSRYSGPFMNRDAAVRAAETDLGRICSGSRLGLRRSAFGTIEGFTP